MANDQSTFISPNYDVDIFKDFQDMTYEDSQLLNVYINLKLNKQQGNIVDETLLATLELRFQNKVITSADWIKFTLALTSMQGFIKTDAIPYFNSKKTEISTLITNKTIEMNAYSDTKKAEILTYTDTKTSEVGINQTNAMSSIQTTKDSALISIEQKKDNIIAYMDGTTAGAIRNDLGIIGYLTTTDKSSLVEAINEVNAKQVDLSPINTKIGSTTLQTTAQDLSGAINENLNKIANLSGVGGNVEKANKSALDTLSTSVADKASWEYVDSSIASYSADMLPQVIPHLGTTTNSGNNYSITTTESITTNKKFTVKINATSTGTATLNISSIGSAKGIKKAGGLDATLKIGVYTFFYDGSNFQILGEGGDYGTATVDKVLTGFTIGTDAGIVPGTLALTGNMVASDLLSGKTGYSNNPLSKITGTLVPFNFVAGNNILFSWTTASSLTSTTPVKTKSATVNVPGTYRINFQIKNQNGAISYGRIYKNGVAYGTQRATASGSYVSYTEDLAFNAGDEIAIYFWSDAYATWYQVCNVSILTQPYAIGLNN